MQQLRSGTNLIRVRKENTDLVGESHYLLYPPQDEYIGESVIKGIVSKWNSWFDNKNSTEEAQPTGETTTEISGTTERTDGKVESKCTTDASDKEKRANSYSDWDLSGNILHRLDCIFI